MKKLKVAVVIPTHSNLKSSLHILFSIYRKLMEEKGISVTIFTDMSNTSVYEGFNVERIRSLDYNNPVSQGLFVLGVPRYYYTGLIKKLEGYDIIETSNPEFYMFAYQSYLAAKKYKTRLVLRTSQTVEGFYLYKFTKFLVNPLARKAYDYAKALLFTNPEAKQRAEKLGLAEKNSIKSIVTGHATETDIFRPLKVKKPDKKIALSVGGLYKIKGHHLIIEAFSKIRKPNIELWIVGEGYYKKQLQKVAEKLKVADKVKFLGAKTTKELAELYNIASVFVLANYQEITPAVNEALACGTPVVVMECGGRGFVIPDESYGLVSRKFDTDDMSRKIQMVLEDSRLAKRIAEKGRQKVLKNFSVEKVAEKFWKGFSG